MSTSRSKADALETVVPVRQQAFEGQESVPSASALKAGASEALVREASRSPYKNKKTGSIYRDAATQTALVPRARYAHTVKATQATQTGVVSRSQQTMVSTGTEMHPWDTWQKPGSTDEMNEDIQQMSPEERKRCRNEAAIKLQCAARCWLARRRLKYLRREQFAKLMLLAEAESAHESDMTHEEATAKRQSRLASMRRTDPQSPADFRLLRADVQTWHAQESKRLDAMNLSEDARSIARQQLCHKEILLLQEIDKMKVKISPEQHDRMALHNMSTLAQPKHWRLRSSNTTVIVDTTETTRARSLMEIYQALITPGLEQDMRLAVLLRAKLAAKGVEPKVTAELVQLLDREAAMTLRGRDTEALDGLRKRISTLFLYLIESPKFNPQASTIKAGQTMYSNWHADNTLRMGIIQS